MRRDVFTLCFAGGQLAVQYVYGAANLDEARAFARTVLCNCSYEIKDGDRTRGNAAVFYSWTCSAAQERHPDHQSRTALEQQATCAQSTTLVQSGQ